MDENRQKDVLKLNCFNYTGVCCGGHTASSCSECPGENGASWCNGVCIWSNEQCISKGEIKSTLFKLQDQISY